MIGAIKQVKNRLDEYFNQEKPMLAQSVPASLFWREGGFGIFYDKSQKKVGLTVDEAIDKGMGRSKIEAMPFNLFISEKNSLKFRVSEHPLQDGTTITDHVHKEMREVTIEGLFTNHPMKKNVASEVKFRDQYGTQDEKSTLSNTALANFNNLKRLALQRIPVRLVCALEIYPKMVITGIDYDRDSKSGSSIRFTMTLRELKTASLKAFKSNYAYTPGSLTTANDLLIAAEKKLGKKTAEFAEAEKIEEQMRQIHNMENI